MVGIANETKIYFMDMILCINASDNESGLDRWYIEIDREMGTFGNFEEQSGEQNVRQIIRSFVHEGESFQESYKWATLTLFDKAGNRYEKLIEIIWLD